MVFYFYFLSRISYLVQNTQKPMPGSNNVKDANNGSNKPTGFSKNDGFKRRLDGYIRMFDELRTVCAGDFREEAQHFNRVMRRPGLRGSELLRSSAYQDSEPGQAFRRGHEADRLLRSGSGLLTGPGGNAHRPYALSLRHI